MERIWSQLKSDSDLLARDAILRNHFVKKGTAKVGSAIQTDMDLLDLSDSEGEDEDSMECDVYNVAI